MNAMYECVCHFIVVLLNQGKGIPDCCEECRSSILKFVIRWPEPGRGFPISLRNLCWFVFAKCRGKQESPPTFILSNKERKKAQKKSFFEIFLSTGGRFQKGNVLAPFLSVVIYGLLGTCSSFSKLFSLCLWVLESFVLTSI